MASPPEGAQRAPAAAPAAYDAGVRVRQATVADLEAVVRLRLALLREHGEHPIYGRLRADAADRARALYGAQLVAAGEAIWLAEAGGEAIGILRSVDSHGSPLLHPARYCYVSSAYVVPAWRRRGVLRRLLGAVEQWCAEEGLGEIRLHNAADNAGAGATWESLGFRAVEVLRVRRVGEGGTTER